MFEEAIVGRIALEASFTLETGGCLGGVRDGRWQEEGREREMVVVARV